MADHALVFHLFRFYIHLLTCRNTDPNNAMSQALLAPTAYVPPRTATGSDFTAPDAASPLMADVAVWFGETTPRQAAMLDAMLNTTTAHLYVTDQDGRHVYVSQSAADALGQERRALLGKTSVELGFPLDVAAQWETERAEALASGKTRSGMACYQTVEGVRDFEYTLHPLPGEDGQMHLVMLRARDVTEHYRAEQARQESEARFRSMIETALDTISILEADGTIRYESPAITEILGYAPHEVEGRTAFHFVHPDDLAHVAERFGQILQEHGVVQSVEYRFRHKDGSWRMLESRGRNLLDDPAVRGIVVNSRDVTEARAAEQALRQHQKSIEALNARLQQGMKETHHRVKNNLQIIAAMVDMQAIEAVDSIPVEEFRRLGTQIRTLAYVHDVLTKEVREDEHAQRISTRDVLTRLLPMLRQMANPRRVSFFAEAAGVHGAAGNLPRPRPERDFPKRAQARSGRGTNRVSRRGGNRPSGSAGRGAGIASGLRCVHVCQHRPRTDPQPDADRSGRCGNVCQSSRRRRPCHHRFSPPRLGAGFLSDKCLSGRILVAELLGDIRQGDLALGDVQADAAGRDFRAGPAFQPLFASWRA